jgi:hypothetical protein
MSTMMQKAYFWIRKFGYVKQLHCGLKVDSIGEPRLVVALSHQFADGVQIRDGQCLLR